MVGRAVVMHHPVRVSASPPPDDLLLLRRVAQGDRAAFGQLVRRHQSAVHRLVRSVSRTPAEAEEALQETFLAAYRGAGTYAGRGSVRSWLLTLARNASFRHRRRRAGEPVRFESLDDLGAAAGWGREPGADEQLHSARRAEVVRRILDELPELDREILILRELEGLSGVETAELLDLTLPAMKSRLHRARLHLAAAVRKEMTDA